MTDEAAVPLSEDKEERPAEENAGIDCHQQEDTDADSYARKEERKLQSGESVRTCPQGAAESCPVPLSIKQNEGIVRAWT